MASEENPMTVDPGRSCPVSAEAAARLDALMTALAADPDGWNATATAIAAGTDEALALANGGAALLDAPAVGWSAGVFDIEAIGGRHLRIESPDGRAFEIFFDAAGTPFAGSLWAGSDDDPTVVPVAFSNDPKRSRLRPLEETIERSDTAQPQAGGGFVQPTFVDPFAALATAAVAAATALRATLDRNEPAKEPAAAPEKPVSPPVSAPVPPPAPPTAAPTAPAPAPPAPAVAGYCEECGEPRRAKARFCRRCGSALPPLSAAAVEVDAPSVAAAPRPRLAPAVPLCPACGGAIEPTWRFCKHCGAPTHASPS